MSASAPAAPLRVAVAGLGTVGAGVLRMLRDNAGPIAARAGRPIVAVAVSARDRARDRGIEISGMAWHDDPAAMAVADGIDTVVELVGGSEGPARATVEAALRAGRPVATANKALLAVRGAELATLAEAHAAPLLFEAAVAGGLPVIKALREGLAGNRVSRVTGILNGTCNYILSAMAETGRDFADVLAEAQRLGYAEADPGFDVDGIDAAHKLAILAALAFGRPVAFGDVHIEGISGVSAMDMAFAREFGYRVKLLCIAAQSVRGVESRVHPCLVPADSQLAHVDGVNNAVVAEGDFVGRLMLQGRGAGAGPTASAVVSDLIDIARGRLTPVWGAAAASLSPLPALGMEAHAGAYYLRLMVQDRPGVIAEVAGVLRDAGVSLESMLQRGRAEGGAVPVVIVTHETGEAAMQQAILRIATLEAVIEPPSMIRIERPHREG